MPCVFPVLSLKIYNVLSQQQENISDKTIKRNFLATILGIIFSFFVLSLITVLLKSLGHSLGWGFQFQSPIFLSFMILILILFSLNLVGLFSIDIPAFLKMYLNKFINLNKNKSRIGKEELVLIDFHSEDGTSIGRSYRDAPEVDNFIRIDEKLPIGEFVDVKIMEAFEYDVTGKSLTYEPETV